MAKQLTESVAYIHDKWVSNSPKDSSKKTSSKKTKSQENEAESEEWISIAHRDIHIGNIFLSWPDSKISSPFPQFLIGDWAQAIHLNPFNLGNGKGNYNRRKALNFDLEKTLECLTDLNHWRRPDVKPENCPIWQFSRLWEEAKVKAYDQGRERIKFDMASYIAETFIPLAEKNIKREMKGKVLSFEWTKPDIPDTIQIFDGDKEKKLKDWIKKNALGRLKKPWDWVDIDELHAEMVSKTKKRKVSSEAEVDSDDAFGFAAPT